MSEAIYAELKNNPAYVQRAERARQNKAPSRSTPLGSVAAARSSGGSRREIAAELRAEDDLTAGQFGTIYYKPATVAGIEVQLEPLQPSIGTAIHGLDLAEHLDLDDPERDPDPNAELIVFLRALWLQRRVLAFRGQGHLSRQQMVQFARHFGEVGAQYGERRHKPNSPHILGHQVAAPGIPDMLILPSDEAVPGAASGWHADATWQQRPPMASMLMCREAPPIGGDTCFCDCYGMWEGLPRETKERLATLTAVHVGNVGHQMDGKTPMAVHPAARTHPETGRTTLYVQQGFVRKFANEHELPEEEARNLLLQLKLQEGRLEYTCRLRWQEGTIALWDNRAVLHSASADFWPHRRTMERLTILDVDESRRTPYYAPSESAETAFSAETFVSS